MAKKYNYTKNGIQYFRKTKTIGYDINGKPKKKEFYGNGEKDCDRKIEEYMQKLKDGINVKAEKMTIEQGMHYWLFNVLINSRDMKSATFDKHECNYRNYIKNREIGYILIQNAVSKPFQNYYNDLYKNGIDIIDLKSNKVQHKEVSTNKIFDLNKTLRSFFTWCISEKITLDNPCTLSHIRLPGNADGFEDETDEGENIQAFSDEEIKSITDNLKYKINENNTFNVAIMLDLITGLRLGELLGMKRKFVSKYIVKVRNTLKRVKIYDDDINWHRETKLIRPKSKSSIRDIPFPIPFFDTLELYFKEQEKKWKESNLKFDDNSLLFTTETCNPIDMKNFSRSWERFLKRAKLEKKKPHSIRDTYATTLIRRGANIHDVKALLGHSSIKITEKYYIFVFPDDKSKTASLLDDLIV